MKNATASSVSPPAEPVTTVSPFGDTIAVNRTVAVVTASSVPVAPEGYKATDAKTRARTLRKVNAEHVPEGREALAQIIDRGPSLTLDLGKHAPRTGPLATLLDRINLLESSLTRIDALKAAHDELYDIAISDMAMVCEQVMGLYNSNVEHDPSIAEHYSKVAKFAALHGETVSQGIARKRDMQQQIDAAQKSKVAVTGTEGK